MFEHLFDNIFISNGFSINQFALCIGCALVTGLIIALFYNFRSDSHSQSFITTLGLLPAITAVVILVVGNNIGAGIAVMGAFSLVRFRSAPGTAKEIAFIFLAMSGGLLIGAGYLMYGLTYAVCLCCAYIIYSFVKMDSGNHRARRKLIVTIPEDLNYYGIFDDIFEQYTSSCKVQRVKTTNMGTMFRLTYEIVIKDDSREKEMIDAIRCRNGNLEVSISDPSEGSTEL